MARGTRKKQRTRKKQGTRRTRRTRRYKTRKIKRGGKKKKRSKSEDLTLVKLINMSREKRMPSKSSKSSNPSDLSKEIIKQHLLDNKFDTNDKVFVLIHANWCPHCTEALPKFNEAQEIIKNDSNCNVYMEEFESDEYPELKNIASGYPTFLEIVNNNIKKYEGSREVDDIVSECRNL